MVGKRGGAIVERMLHKLVVDMVREDVREALPGAAQASVPSEALVQFIAGALFGVLTWWLDARTRLSVAEVDAFFRRLAIPALKAARGDRL